MAFALKDRVRDTTTTTGTGPFTVSGTPPQGYKTFSAAYSTSDTFLGTIAHLSADEWVTGLLTYSASNQVTVTTILDSSSGGSAVSFSAGTKDVFVGLPAARAQQAMHRPSTNDFRLTLTSGVPVTTSDVTAATNLYLSPKDGNTIALWDGAQWLNVTSAEVTESLSGLTANSNFDVFAYLNSGAVDLETLIWTNATTRATAIARTDGVLTKSGDKTRRWVGSFRTTASTGQTEDSETKRFLFNANNRIPRKLKRGSATTSYTQTSGTWMPWLNETTAIVEFLVGDPEEVIDARFDGLHSVVSSGTAYVGFDLDGTTTGTDADFVAGTNSSSTVLTVASAIYRRVPPLGYHYLQLMQQKGASNTTFYGTLGDLTYGASGTFYA